MCYRTKLDAKQEHIEKVFNAHFVKPEMYEPKEEINGFTFSPTPVIADEVIIPPKLGQ